MTKERSFIFLIVALVLSHFVVYQVEIADTILLKGIKFKIFPLIAFSGNMSSNLTWVSVIAGYLLFCIYLLMNFKNVQKENAPFYYFVLILCAGAFLFEYFIIYKIYTGNYSGQFSRVGLILFLLCLRINSVIYKTSGKDKV